MQTDGFIPQTGSDNGHTLAPVPPDEWQRIEQAYREIQRRDSSAEHRTWRAERIALALLGLLAIALGAVLWLATHAHTVQAFVQVVQVDEKGQLVQVGIPQDLLTYSPPEGLWMDMLGEWVRRVRWRGTDATLARAEWAWVYRHTCGQARRLLQALEAQEKPFETGKVLRTVELKSVTKTPVPESYQVLWVESMTMKTEPTVKAAFWTGTFSVGRYRPPTLVDTLENRLGLCVTAYDLSLQP